MHLIKIGNTVINLDNVQTIDLDPYDKGVVNWIVGVMFVGGAGATTGVYDRIFEHSEAAMLMDWCRRNARDVQDWRGEQQEEQHGE